MYATTLFPSSPFLICGFAVCITAAFAAGYVLRMKERWPRLHEFRRSEYAQVWDALSSTPSTPDELVAYYAKAGFSTTRVAHNALLSLVGVK